uniref:Venom dipeptidyl peptidase 4 n=1 Tax=Stomoxys calcitrans TaxID=35570 RepID=A0A1I8Q502_STOCA
MDEEEEIEQQQQQHQKQQRDLEDREGRSMTGDSGHLSGGSFDTDSTGLTEGRHCDLFSDKQGSVVRYEANHVQPPSSVYGTRSGSQIRINSANRIANEASKVVPTIAAISGSRLGSLARFDKSSMEAGSRNSLHHNIYSNDSYESRYANDHSMTASSTFLLEDAGEGPGETVEQKYGGKTYRVPLDIPTPPPQPQMVHNRPTLWQQRENIGSLSKNCSHNFHQITAGVATAHRPHPACRTTSSSVSLQQQAANAAVVNSNETPLANGLSHHHQQRHHYHHTQQQQQHQSLHHSMMSGLNLKLQEPQQHQQQQLLHRHYSPPHQGAGNHLGQHHHHHQPPSGAVKMQQLQHPMFPQLSPCLSINQRNSFHHMDNKDYMKSREYSPQKLRKVRTLLLILGAIVLLGLLGTAIYFIVSGSSDSSNNEESDSGPSNGIHLDDILQGKLISRPFNGSWSSTGPNVLYKENNAIMELNVKTKVKTRLMLDEKQQYVLYEKSADGQFLLLAKNYKKNFRHSYEAEYDIYNISSGHITPLLIQNQVHPLIMVQWAPVGNALVINFQRNLYYKPTAFATEIALTDDKDLAILNGIPDWVYEEEVFSSNSAVWFSPDGSQLAFIQFDDSPTPVINFPIYGEAGDIRFQYPYNRLVAYPKAGASNPRVKLFTSDLARAAAGNTDHLTEIPRPSGLNTESDYIITVVDWLNSTNVLSVWMNRIQNSATIQIFNGLRRQEIFSLNSKTGWVDIFSAPFKNRDGSRIALILPQAQDGDSGEYRHLCLLSTSTTRSQPEAITKGKYVVTSILHWDTGSDVIFYTANTEQNPEYLHIYSIKAATGQTAKCLTCKLHTSNGVEQTYYSADFNTANQLIITSVGPSIPMTAVYEWSVSGNQVSLTKLMDWEHNDALREKLKDVALPTHEIITVPISGGFTAKVLLQLPPNLDRSGNTKYPMLVDVYGGPDSYSVVNRWIMDWGTYLSSNQSVIYAKIDGRGSGLRGEKLLHSVYLKLGTVEIADQIDVARHLQQKFDFIDAEHTGIWGWSYGGYAAAMALANDETKVFRCAASIAPVTDWAYYDSIYTERYMSLPSLNEVGYSNSRLSTRALKLKGKKFLLVHGTLDDNVHYQQAMILAKNLERHDILFKQISYPDEDHALAGVRPHLYHSLDRFFGDCFAQKRMVYRK